MINSEKIKSIGRDGEKAALKYLLNNGYIVVETNYWSRAGEIDLIFWDNDYLIFAEVKSSGKDSSYHLGFRVDIKKQRHIIATALDYMTKHNPKVSGYRFDVILVQRVTMGVPKIEHIKDAFNVEENENYV